MQDRPTATELLEAASAELERTLVPAVQGIDRYRLKVAVNIMRIVARELAATGSEADEAARLEALLGHHGALASLEAELCQGIRSGALDDRWPQVMEHVRQSARERLSVANPDYLSARFGRS
jgi:hypothetical protein